MNDDRHAALEARVAALERHIAERPNFRYAGVWRADLAYAFGDVTTWGGSLWHCGPAGSRGEKPGAGRTEWKLMCKRGRDARDRARS